MQAVFELIGKVAGSQSTVLLCGESGTGKELVARAIHDHSPRQEKPFIKKTRGHQSLAARILGIDRRTLYRKSRKYHLDGCEG